MTMHLLTMPRATSNSWARGTSPYQNNLPLHLILLHMTFFFSPTKLKGIIKRTHFKDVEAIKGAITMELRGIPKESFQQCIEEWQRRMGKCIRLKEDYFEIKTMLFGI